MNQARLALRSVILRLAKNFSDLLQDSARSLSSLGMTASTLFIILPMLAVEEFCLLPSALCPLCPISAPLARSIPQSTICVGHEDLAATISPAARSSHERCGSNRGRDHKGREYSTPPKSL